LAPELVLSKGHDKSVDYWALGCLIYELIVGRTPFQVSLSVAELRSASLLHSQDDHQPEIFKKIIHSERALSFPRGFDSTAADLVRRLLTPNPAFRLGNAPSARERFHHNLFCSGNLNGGVREIMGHRWFTSVDYSWAALEGKVSR
jgi:cGMP-dependent protein kinase